MTTKNVSKNLKDNLPTLALLLLVPAKVQQAVITASNTGLIRALCEISFNCRIGNIRCTDYQKSKLRKYRKSIYYLGDKKNLKKTCVKQRKVLNQKGGVLIPLLLKPALNTLADLV